jgi:hypothetical protein
MLNQGKERREERGGKTGKGGKGGGRRLGWVEMLQLMWSQGGLAAFWTGYGERDMVCVCVCFVCCVLWCVCIIFFYNISFHDSLPRLLARSPLSGVAVMLCCNLAINFTVHEALKSRAE